MSLNDYVTLGNSGLKVSPFCLGAMTFGDDWSWGSSVEDSCAILDYYLDSGGNFIDTANIYTKGHSEKIIGDHIGRYPSKRDRVVIATKFFGSLYPGDPNAGGAGRKAIMAQCEQSLRRLQTDYIDLYWLHAYDVHTPIEETMMALDDLVKSGKVRYIGFSDTPAWETARAQVTAKLKGWTPLIALQIEYSLAERTVEEELIPMAIAMGLGVTPWSPLRYGVLTGKYTRENIEKQQSNRGNVKDVLDDKAFDIIDKLVEVSQELQVSPAQVALAWVQSRSGVASSIIGARTLEHLKDNLKALDVVLREKDLEVLNEVSNPALGFTHKISGRVGPIRSGGTTINGEKNPVWELSAKDGDRY